MDRRDLQDLARARLREARILLAAGEPSGAYYLCGYSVECALKACITKQFARHQWPDKTLVMKSHTHDLQQLVSLAGLSNALTTQLAIDPQFAVNWKLVVDWKETSRYQTSTIIDARDLIDAVRHPQHGALRWIRTHW